MGEPEIAVKDEGWGSIQSDRSYTHRPCPATAPKEARNSDPFLVSEKSFDHLRVMENGMAERITPPPTALATSPQPFRLHSVFSEADAIESETENNNYDLGSPRLSSTPRFLRFSYTSSPRKCEDEIELESLSEYPMPAFPSPVHI